MLGGTSQAVSTNFGVGKAVAPEAAFFVEVRASRARYRPTTTSTCPAPDFGRTSAGRRVLTADPTPRSVQRAQRWRRLRASEAACGPPRVSARVRGLLWPCFRGRRAEPSGRQAPRSGADLRAELGIWGRSCGRSEAALTAILGPISKAALGADLRAVLGAFGPGLADAGSRMSAPINARRCRARGCGGAEGAGAALRGARARPGRAARQLLRARGPPGGHGARGGHPARRGAPARRCAHAPTWTRAHAHMQAYTRTHARAIRSTLKSAQPQICRCIACIWLRVRVRGILQNSDRRGQMSGT